MSHLTDLRGRLTTGLGLAVAATLLGALVSSAPAFAEGEILGAGAEDAIAGSYIVKLKDGHRSSAVDSLLSRYDGDLTASFPSTLGGFAAELSAAQARRLAADPRVEYVEVDREVTIAATQENPPSWGLDRIDERKLPMDGDYTYPRSGKGVTVYVIDTGVLTSHNTFGGRARSGRDFVDDDSNAKDCNGHGTHVAGTIAGAGYGVAKGASIVGVRVLDCEGSGSSSDVIAGIEWVTSHAKKPAVANMSLGGLVDTSIDDAVSASIGKGVTYAIAAGNGLAGTGVPLDACLNSPGRVPAAITVAAVDKTDTRASWSNFGSCVDIFAPGVDITSAWIGGNSKKNTISGTSMAAPHVAGAAAVYLAAHKGATPAQVRTALVNASTKDVVKDALLGSPNRLLYVT